MQMIESKKMDCGFVFGRHQNKKLEFTHLSDIDLEIAVPFRFKEGYLHADFEAISKLPWIVPETFCPLVDEVQTVLNRKGIHLSNRIIANDDITKYAFIKKQRGGSVLEKNEALVYASKKTIFLWDSSENYTSSLFFVHARHRINDSLIRAVKNCFMKIWNTSSD